MIMSEEFSESRYFWYVISVVCVVYIFGKNQRCRGLTSALFFSALAAAALSVVCFPTQAVAYCSQARELLRDYLAIYRSFYGQNNLHLPALPGLECVSPDVATFIVAMVILFTVILCTPVASRFLAVTFSAMVIRFNQSLVVSIFCLFDINETWQATASACILYGAILYSVWVLIHNVHTVITYILSLSDPVWVLIQSIYILIYCHC
jgi:hypothetical protein